MRKHRPIVVLVSDLHFSHRPSAARSVESDWYAVMARQWAVVRRRAEKDRVPIVVAGDVFDHWKSPPELVNFVIGLFRGTGQAIYAIPGQHDLPNHRYDDMMRSSYGTLIQAEAIVNIPATGWININGLVLWSFPWGFEIAPLENPHPDALHLAVCHRYVWSTDKTCYAGAPLDANLAVLKKKLEGYDAAVFGDNHKGFEARSGRCNVLNCGGFIPRKSDEVAYQPGFGVLYDDGTIDRIPLDTELDRWVAPDDARMLMDDACDPRLAEYFESLGSDAIDFSDALVRHMDRQRTPEAVRRLVVSSLQKGQEDGS